MNNLRKLRSERNLTLRGLSEKVLVNYVTLGKLEREETSFNNDYIKLLCDFFDVSSDYLLGLSKIRTRGHNLKPIPLYNLSDEIIDYLPLFNLSEIGPQENLLYLKLDFNMNVSVVNTTFYSNDILLLKLIDNRINIIPNTFYLITRPQFENKFFRIGFTMNDSDFIYYGRLNISSQRLSHDYLKTENIGNNKTVVYQILSVHRQF